MKGLKTPLSLLILLLVIPAVVLIGLFALGDKHYYLISLLVAVLSCLPLFYCFERRENSSKEMTVLAVVIALSAAGRIIFVWLPGFKPVTAITIITAIYLGREAGFVVGALSAIVSNIYFGQGPWTPFQMFAWGIIGFFAGLLMNGLQKNKVLLCVFGALSGVFFSLTMDLWVVLSADSTLNPARFLAAIITAVPTTVEYIVSNIVFLLLLAKPIGKKLERLKKKYGLFLVKKG